MNKDSSLLSGAAASRKKRDVIGEWPWQLRSLTVVLCGLAGFYLMLTDQATPTNWFQKFVMPACLAFLTAVHAYALLLWLYDLVRGKPEPADNSTPELD